MSYDPGVPLLEHIASQMSTLRRSERKVADIVVENPTLVVESTMATLAEAGGVSEPTVMRFCTSLGFDGFQQFKLALAQTLALGLPATLSTISTSDGVPELATKVFDHTISSLDRTRRYLDFGAIDAAIEAVLAASSMTVVGLGTSAMIALDVEQKAVLFGVPCSAPSDSHQQFMSASTASAGQVFLVISNTGTTASVVQVARTARERGATVVAITGDEGSALAAESDVVLSVKTFEDTDRFTPTVSRIAALVIVDVLATAVSLHRGDEHAQRLASMKEQLVAFRRLT
ncbi:MurR/RpiR family transcriptional regulator [Frigoribacterium sp. PhB24]|uniref:MurR/RpiR family transcriptional regulator n=1 Tax=Frigoribacterium sp. PhB24 TaxID=2485204 RepID=UPI000F483902|nr:MurR/RpiR family transcriptional regulator [Frigoribacterium sp. PhB24]ROS48861.1 RpiR family transcriptional regulator [Frigoribacterium sp. PhB24]